MTLRLRRSDLRANYNKKLKIGGYSKEKIMIVGHFIYDKIKLYTSMKGIFSC